MNVLFINPNLSGIVGQNIGFSYVITAVAKENKVALLDYTFHENDYKKHTLSFLKSFQADAIAFSVNSANYRAALLIAGILRKNLPGVPFLWGGVHPTLMPEETISSPLVDAICIGEGEVSSVEYFRCLSEGRRPEVAGIWYKDSKGEICKNNLRPYHNNLDDFSFPDWSYWDMKRYFRNELFFNGGLRHLASRGCPYSCTFCSNKALREASPGKHYRLRDPSKVIEEITINYEKFKDSGLTSIFMSDEIFGMNPGWLKEFCHLYIKEGLRQKIPWVCTTRADIITKEWAETVAEAGCIMVSLGVESGDDRVRNGLYRKMLSKEQIKNAVVFLKNAGVGCNISVIVGAPGETKDSIKKTLSFANELNPLTTLYIFYWPLPKVELSDDTLQRKAIHRKKFRLKNSYFLTSENMSSIFLVKLSFIIKLRRITNVIKKSYAEKGWLFWGEILSVLLSWNSITALASGNIHLIADLEQKILYSKLIDNWKHNNT